MLANGDLLRLGDETLAARRFGEAATIYLRAYQAARGRGAGAEQTIALSQLALAHLSNGSAALSGLWLERAAKLASPRQPRAWLSYLTARARWERYRGSRQLAADTLQEAFACALACDAVPQAAGLALALSLHGPAEQQLDWARTALATALHGVSLGEGPPALDPLPYWENLAWSLSLAGRHQEALSAFSGARRALLLSGDSLLRIRADLNMGRALRLAGQLRSAQGWLRETEDWLAALLRAAPQEGEARLLLARLRGELAECSLALGRRTRALALLASGQALAAQAFATRMDAASTLEAELADRIRAIGGVSA